jgi:uncharacterized membrane protein YcgQ (UPF0703/DUF1980 family)
MSAHDHTHEHEENSYYLDQLCMVAVSAAFGGVCLALYFWKTTMLKDMLAPQFHTFVLLSGITLVLLAIVRAANLWVQVGQEKAKAREHHHHDEHGCCHDHEHQHAPGEHHEHDHHHHDHDAADHDHGWAPWRYVVLMIPLVLFLLGLPRKGREVEDVKAEFTMDAVVEAVGLIGSGSEGWSPLVYVAYLGKDEVKGEVFDYDFKKLEEEARGAAASSDPNVRAEWKDKAIRVIGKFAPSRESQREFGLIRYRISCCASDAIPLTLPILSRENVNIPRDTWVQVTGRVEFRKRRDENVAVIVVSGKDKVVPCPPDANPYIQ